MFISKGINYLSFIINAVPNEEFGYKINLNNLSALLKQF